MKRLPIFLLMFWFVLQAGLAQAHVAMEDVHRMAHATGDAHHEAAPGSNAANDSGDDSELCGVAHCCHSAGVLLGSVTGFAVAPSAHAPAGFRPLPLRTPPPEIERPKWRLATPAVASFPT